MAETLPKRRAAPGRQREEWWSESVLYRSIFDMMSTFDCRLYAATSTASASHYNTVHFRFDLELHSDQSVGSGVRESNIPVNTHTVATYCARRIGLRLSEPYGIEDLCCSFVC